MLTAFQKTMVGHGALILFVGMCAGIGLLMSLLGGIELIPGHILPASVPGSTDAWVRAHVGGMLNALLIFALAWVIPGVGFSNTATLRLGWLMIGTGWANSVFYWAALFAPNRAISFADNRFGPSNLATLIGLTPALLFVVLSLVVIFMIARQALWAGSKQD
jgi:hypothetical protein